MIYDSNGLIRIFGHHKVQKYLYSLSARNILIYGPYSVGKSSILEKYVEILELEDVLRFGYLTPENIDQFRQETVVSKRNVRVIMFRINNLTKIREKLLKIIEDSPSNVIFLASSTFYPGMTLSTRFTVFKVGHLAPSDISLILMRKGYSAEKAAALAELNLGSVSTTMYYGKFSEFKPKVMEAIAYINEGKVESVDSLYNQWEEGHSKLLYDIAAEKISGRYRLSNEEELAPLTKKTAMNIVRTINPNSRPRFVPRTVLSVLALENRK